MPDLPFVAKGITDVLTGQEKMRIGATALRDLYKQQNLEMAGAANAARSAVAGTLTAMERIEKKIADVRAGLSKGVIDPAKGEAALKRLQGRLDELKKSSDEAGRGMAKAFGNEAFSFLTRWVGPAGAIAGSLKIVSTEIREQLRLIDESARAKMTVSEARNRVIRTLDVPDSQKSAFLQKVSDMAAKNGSDEAALLIAAETGLSRSGGNAGATLSALEGTSKYLFDQPGAWTDFVGGQLAMQKVTGSQNPYLNIGLMKQTGTLSAVADQTLQAKNVPTALIGLKGFGLDNAESAALFSTFTTEANDTTGEPTSTAVISLARAIRDFRADDLSEKQSAMLGAGGIDALRRIEGLAFDDKLQALQADQRLSSTFLAGYGGEAKYRAQIEQLVSSSSSGVSRSYRDNIARVGSDEQLIQIGRSAVESLNANPLNRQSKYEARLAAIDQQLAIRDPNENLGVDARQRYQNIMMRTGQSSLESSSRMAIARFGDDSIGLSIDEADRMVENVIADLEDGTPKQTRRIGRGTFKTTPAEPASSFDLEIASMLRGMLEESKKQTTLAQKQVDKTNAAQILTR